ncbi:hypothetical protein NE237_022166 [Protea cynaroides]|uniref:Jacalin-type lectin domain-containing protein n=1 Tax=Protea cynaroides TaxID=273540 RepID=A0A9Q0H991_9MAGN|nr:hypothetical protein NE237_022166 [Protea cynaroides]
MWIRSIQTAHMVGEKLQLSEKHGEDGRMFKTVDIDYPYEFLTGISGFTGSITDSDCNPVLIKRACGNSVVKSLTFETNRRKIGPYGQEEGTPFCIQMGTKRCFGGFHGRKNPLIRIQVEIMVKTAYILDEKLKHSDKHGGDHGDMFKTVEIDYPSEFLTGISGNKHCACGVKSLMFETTRREFGPFGGRFGTHFSIQMGSKRCFGGFHGTDYLCSIGVYVKSPNPLKKTILCSPSVVPKGREELIRQIKLEKM